MKIASSTEIELLKRIYIGNVMSVADEDGIELSKALTASGTFAKQL